MLSKLGLGRAFRNSLGLASPARSLAAIAVAVGMLAASMASAAVMTWSVGDGDWTTGTWSNSTFPTYPGYTDDAVIDSVSTVTVDGAQVAKTLTLTNEAKLNIPTGNSLTVSGSISVATVTLPAYGVTMANNSTLSAASGNIGSLNATGNVAINATGSGLTLTIPSYTATVPLALTKGGVGTLALTNVATSATPLANTALRVEAGVLSSQGSNPLGGATSVTLAGGELKVSLGGYSAPATPTTTGMNAWFDASKGVALSGTTVTGWADQSGNGHNASVGNGTPALALNNVNGLPAVQFRGNDDSLSVAGTLFAKEQYYVFRCDPSRTTWSNYGSVFGKNNDNRNSSYLFENNNTIFHSNLLPLAVSKNGTPLSSSGQFNMGTINQYMVLKVDMTNNNTTPTSYSIGGQAGYRADMDIAEILSYSSTLSSTDENNVGAYLAYKYGITTSSNYGNGGPQAAVSGNLNMASTNLTVEANSTLNAGTDGSSTFGNLNITSGVLTAKGSPTGINFAATSVAAAATGGIDAKVPVTLGPLTLGNAATFSAAGSVTSGTTTLSGATGTINATNSFNIGKYSDGGSTKTLTLGGAGTKIIDNSTASNIVAANTTLRIAGGVVDATNSGSNDPLGGATAIQLAGGKLTFAGVVGMNPGAVTYDFESGNLNGWTNVPYSGGGNNNLFLNGNEPKYQGDARVGNYGINTYEANSGNSDNWTGIIQTDPFTVNVGNHITFKIASAPYAFSGSPESPNSGMTSFNLERLVSGVWEMVQTKSHGTNWDLESVDWDTSAYVGQTLRLRVYDTNTGGWGHIAVDDINLSNINAIQTGPVEMTDKNFTVDASSELSVSTPSHAYFGTLALNNGVLTVSGNPLTTFTSTSVDASATQVGFSFGSTLTLDAGVITGNSATGTFVKAGAGTLTLNAGNTGLQNMMFDVQGGKLAAVTPASLGGSVSTQLSGGSLLLSSTGGGGAAAYDIALNVTQNSTLTAGTAAGGASGQTVTLGSASKALTVASGKTLTVNATNGYALGFSGSINVLNSGVMTVSGANVTTNNSIHLNNNAVMNFTSTGGSINILDATALTMDSGSTINLYTGTMTTNHAVSVYNLNLAGGALQLNGIGAAKSLDVQGTLTVNNAATNLNLTGGAVLSTAGGATIDLVNGTITTDSPLNVGNLSVRTNGTLNRSSGTAGNVSVGSNLYISSKAFNTTGSTLTVGTKIELRNGASLTYDNNLTTSQLYMNEASRLYPAVGTTTTLSGNLELYDHSSADFTGRTLATTGRLDVRSYSTLTIANPLTLNSDLEFQDHAIVDFGSNLLTTNYQQLRVNDGSELRVPGSNLNISYLEMQGGKLTAASVMLNERAYFASRDSRTNNNVHNFNITENPSNLGRYVDIDGGGYDRDPTTGSLDIYLNGANTYTGNTNINGATVLVANDGTGLPTNSTLYFQNGVLGTNGTFTRTIGSTAGAGRVYWNGAGGFAGYGGPLTVSLAPTGGASGDKLYWNNSTTGFNNQSLYLGSSNATNNVTLTNPIEINDYARIYTQSLTTLATLSGNLTGSSEMEKNGIGTLVLSGNNSDYSGNMYIHRGAVDVGTNGIGLGTGALVLRADTSDQNYKGAILQGKGTLAKDIGWYEAGKISWDRDGGGFAARGGALNVTLNSGADLSWGSNTNGFNSTRLMFGSGTADNIVTLTNNIDAQNGYRYFYAFDNPNSSVDKAVLSGTITNLRGGEKRGDGVLELSQSLTTVDGEQLRNYGGGTLKVNGNLQVGSLYTGADARYIGSSNYNFENYEGSKLNVTGNVQASRFYGGDNANSVTNVTGNVTLHNTYEQDGGSAYIGGNLSMGDSNMWIRNTTTMVVNGDLRVGAPWGTGADRNLYFQNGADLIVNGTLRTAYVQADWGTNVNNRGGSLHINGTAYIGSNGDGTMDMNANSAINGGGLDGSGIVNATTVNLNNNAILAGTLALNLKGTATLNSNSVLSPGGAGVGTLSINRVDGSGGNLTLNNSSIYNFDGGDLVKVSGALTVNDNWTLKLLAGGNRLASGGSITLFNYGSLGTFDYVPTFDVSALIAANWLPAGFNTSTLSISAVSGKIVLSGIQLSSPKWSGLGADDNWKTDGNWDIPAGAGSVLQFEGTTRPAPYNNFDAGTSFAGLKFNASAGEFTLTGNSISLSGDIVNNSTSPQIINLQMALSSATMVNTGSAMAMGGDLSGTGGSLIKSGTGTLTLNGTNTYTGGTQINQGTVKLGNSPLNIPNAALTVSGGTLDLNGFSKTMTAPISFQSGTTSGGTLVNNGSAYDGQAGTVSASLQGTAGLTKTTAGELVLTGANNTYSGPTAINGGTLRASGTLASAITFTSSGAHLATGPNSATVGSLTVPSLTLISGSIVDFKLVSTSSNDLFIIGNTDGLFVNGGKIGLYTTAGATFSDNGKYNLFQYSGTAVATDLTRVLNRASGKSYTFSTDTVDSIQYLQLNIADMTVATVVWNGGFGTQWSTTDNWQSSTLPSYGASIKFAAVAGGTANNDILTTDDTLYSNLIFDTAAGQHTVTGNPITLMGAGGIIIANSSSVTQNVNLPLTLSGSGDINAASGPIVLGSSATIANAGNTVSFAGPYNISVAGAISGIGGLSKSGTGTLTLTGNNTYSGNTAVSGGTLEITEAGSLGTAGVYGGNIATGINSTVRFASSVSQTLSGNITGDGGVTFNGSANTGTTVLTLNGTNTYGGETFISGPVNQQYTILRAGSTQAFGDPTTASLRFGQNTSQARNVIDLNGYNQTVIGLNAPDGNNGGGYGSFGSYVGNLATGTTATLTVNNTADNYYGGWLGDAGGVMALVKDGPGALTLRGFNTNSNWSGGTTIKAGSFRGAVFGTGGLTFNVTAGSTGRVQLNGSDATLPSLTTDPANAGTAIVENGAGTGSNSILTINNATANTYAGILQDGSSGKLALTKTGVGVLTLSGTMSQTGPTFITNGTLRTGADNVLNGTVIGDGYGGIGDSAGNNGVLDLNNHNDTVTAFAFGTGNSGTVMTGTGTLTFVGTDPNQTAVGADSGSVSKLVSGKLNLGTASRIFLNRGPVFNISAAISGNSGSGIIFREASFNLSGANTYDGDTYLDGGQVQIGVGNGVGDSVGNITSSAIGKGNLVFNNGAISSDGTTPRTILNPVSFSVGNNKGGTFGNATNNGKLTFLAPVDLGATGHYITINSPVAFDGGFINGGGFWKYGAAELTLGTPLPSTVEAAVAQGVLRITADGVLNGSNIGVGGYNNDSTFDLDGHNGTVGNIYFGVENSGNRKLEELKTGAGTLTLNGVINQDSCSEGTKIISGNLLLTGISHNVNGGPRSLTISANIFGADGASLVNNGGWLILSGTNTYNGGTSVPGGSILIYGKSASKPSVGTTTVAANSTLGLGVGGAGYFGADDVTALFAGTLANVTNTNYIVGIDTTAGDFAYSASVPSTTRGLTKFGPNTLTLSGSNEYTGVTKVVSGTLAVDNLPNGGVASPLGLVSSDAANLQFADGTTFKYTGPTATTDRRFTMISGGMSLDASGLGAITFANPLGPAGDATMTLTGTNTDANTFAGVISAGSLVKSGVGKWVLSAQETYPGSTTVNAGTLVLAGGDHTLAAYHNLTVNGGTLDLGSNKQYVRYFSGTGGSVTGSGTFTTNPDATASFAGNIGGSVNFIKAGNQTLTLTGANSTTGTINVIGGGLTLKDGGTIAGATAVNVRSSTLNLDNTGTNVATRLGAVPIALDGGALSYSFNSTATADTLGAVTANSGYNTITVNPGSTGSSQLTLASFARTAGAIVSMNSNNLGQIGAANPSLKVTGSNLTPINGVVPGVLYNGGFGNWVGYDSGLGFGQLGTTGFPFTTYNSGSFADAPVNANVQVQSGTVKSGGQVVNSMSNTWDTSFANAYDLLTITSGMYYQAGNETSGGVNLGTTAVRGRVTSGLSTGELFYMKGDGGSGNGNPGNTNINAVIEDNGGTRVSLVVMSGSRPDQPGMNPSISAPNTYTGGTFVQGFGAYFFLHATSAGIVTVPAANNPSNGLVINSATVNELNFGGQIDPSNIVTLNGGSTLNLYGNNTLAGLVFNSNGGTGTPSVTAGNTLTITSSIVSTPTNVAVTPTMSVPTLDLGFQPAASINVSALPEGNYITGVGPLNGLTISSVIQNGGITKKGTGVLNLTGANTFGGQLTVEQGVLNVASVNNASANGPLGNSASSVILGKSDGSTGAIEYTGGTVTSSKSFTMATGGTGAFQIDTAGTTLTLGSPIDGGGSLAKTGPGTLELTNASNTHNGTTTVTAGTLKLTNVSTNNNIASSSAIAINGGATLNVIGLTSNTLVLSANQQIRAYGPNTATITGGVDAGAYTIDLQNGTNLGTLSITQGLALSGGTLKFDIGASGADKIAITGAASFGGVANNIINVAALTGLTSIVPGNYDLITAASGLIGNTFTLATPTQITLGSNRYNLSLITPTIDTLQQLKVEIAPPNVATTYSLSASLSPTRILTGGTATLSGRIKNEGVVNVNDNLNYTLSAAIDGVSGGTLGTLTNSAGSNLAATTPSSPATATYTAPGSVGPITLNLSAGTAYGSNGTGNATQIGSNPTATLAVVAQRTFSPPPTTIELNRFLVGSTLTGGTTAIISSGSHDVTADATLDDSHITSTNLGTLALGLASGSKVFNGSDSFPQTANFVITGGSVADLGPLTGASFSVPFTDEFNNISSIPLSVTGTAVKQRAFTVSSGTLGRFLATNPGVLTVSSTGEYSTTSSGTLGSFFGTSSGTLTTSNSTFNGPQASTFSLAPLNAGDVLSNSYTSSITDEFPGAPRQLTLTLTGTAVASRKVGDSLTVLGITNPSTSDKVYHAGATFNNVQSSSFPYTYSNGLTDGTSDHSNTEDARVAKLDLTEQFDEGEGFTFSSGSQSISSSLGFSGTFSGTAVKSRTDSTTFNLVVTPELSGGTTANAGFSINVYSGNMAWSSSSGNWIAGSKWDDKTLNGLDGSHVAPGLDANTDYKGTDTATFDGTGASQTVTEIDLNSVNPSLSALTFSSTGYKLTGGSLTMFDTLNGGTATINVSGGTDTIASLLSLTSTTEMTVGTGRLNIIGKITGSGALVKVGSGTLVLSSTSSYEGGTVVNEGKLSVNGSLASPVMVNSGGTLGGTGSLTSVTVNADGHLSPGNSPGTLHLSGSLTLLAGAAMDFELDTLSTSDEISMPSGYLSLNGQQFTDFLFTPLAGFGPGNYTLIDAGLIDGSLGTNRSGVVGGRSASLFISGNDLMLNVVPEPSSLALLGVGAIGLAGCAWRRRTLARRTTKPAAFDQIDHQDDSPTVLSMPSRWTESARRAA